MSLDDFLAKKAKKKGKKKVNIQDLMEKLVLESETSNDVQETYANTDHIKPADKEDEWESIDDDLEIDLQDIRIGRLCTTKADESGKQGRDSGGEECKPEEEKKVWAMKAPQPVEPPPPLEQPKSSVYVPAPLRRTLGGSSRPAAAKPNVSSSTDFPTLDAAIVAAPPTKTVENVLNVPDDDDDASWQKAGARKPVRGPDTLPVPSDPPTTAYVPPCLRHNPNEGVAHSRPSTFLDSQNYKPRNEVNRPSETIPNSGWRDNERSYTHESKGSSTGWTRGNVITYSKTDPFVAKTSNQWSGADSTIRSRDTTQGWTQNVNVKTYRETVRDEPSFELVQTNRFAGLSET